MENEWKPRFHEQEHESEMRLLKTHSHTSERQGTPSRKGTEGLAVRDRNSVDNVDDVFLLGAVYDG